MRISDLTDEKVFKKKIIDQRRRLHMCPELSEEEVKTADMICEFLDGINVPYKKNIAGHGVMAWISGDAGPGPVIGVRGDMDALPIEEENNTEYRSQVPGVMHACGHDAHVTILLGLAELLSIYKDRLKGTVKLIFQPAEETIGGANRMIQEGVLENPDVDYMLGLHVEPQFEAGKVGIKYGKMYAASDMIDVVVHGKSAHGAHPDQGVDVICVAAEIITAVQVMIAREVSPLDSAVCTFGCIKAGTARNQIADRLEMEGIIRTLDPAARMRMRNRVEQICRLSAQKMGAEVEFIVHESYGSLINNNQVTGLVQETAEELLGKENVVIEEFPDLGCEDFSFFAEKKPSCYFHLGSYNEKLGERVDLHNSKYDIDEECLFTGIELQLNNIINIGNKFDKR